MADRFSVSMCVYEKDRPDWFREAVDSILNQTNKPDEVVLVVDGPVPLELDQVIQDLETRKDFRVIRLAENQGHGNARRICLEQCQYELVALMDSDDISHPKRFEKQLAVMAEHPELSIIGSNITEFVGEPHRVIGARIVPQTDAEIKKYMQCRCPMNQVTVMFRKADVEQAGGYLDWYCEEDYYLWLRMHLAGMRFANLSDALVNVRIGEEMYQRRGGWRYFRSEAKLQSYMLKKKIIGFPRYVINCSQRLVVQVLLPDCLRGWVFKKFARKNVW